MPTLNGGLGYIPTPQTTVDLYHLSDAMGGVDPTSGLETTLAFKKDFADSPNGDWIDGYHPYASDTEVYSNGTYSRNSISNPTRSLNAGHIAHSYLHDYYFRIHLNPYSIALGNVLTEQTHYVEIWNAWFNTETLSAIDNVGLSDLNISLNEVSYNPYDNTTGYTLATVPYTYNALESTLGVVTVPAIGVPTLNGYYLFVFGTSTPALEITGQRVILWPYNTLRKFQEKRAYLTDVILSMSNESRIPLREVPRLSVEYSNVFLSTEEYTSAKQLATKISHIPIAVPQWSDLVKVTGIIAGQTIIYFNTAGMELIEGNAILLWKSWNFWEVAELLKVYPDSIVLSQGLLNKFNFCWVTPIIIGYTDNGINLSENSNKDLVGSVSVTSEYCYYEAVDSFTQFKGLPVWERTAILSEGLQNKYSRNQEVSETATGLIQRFDIETYSRQVTKLSTYVRGKSSLNTLRREFDFLQGRFKAFWLPTFKGDIIPTTPIAIGTGTVDVLYTDKSTYPIDYIYVSGKDINGNTIGECFKISGIANNFNGTEILAFETAATKTFTIIKTISIMLKVRLDSDIVTTQHLGHDYTGANLYVIDIPVKEVV